jgi:S-adenosylmethionine/arginine decarboxylase-like enzyme
MPRQTRKIKKTYWGHHLIINAAGCDGEAIRSAATIKAFTKELVDKIHMKAYGKPMVVRFGEGNKLGYSLVQLIETSNITGHFVEETNDIYLDIFSCKEFIADDAIKVIKKYFNPKKMQKQMLKRQA